MSAASFQSEINEIPHKFSKLLFDVEKLKKPKKIASTYHITSGERIFGYIKSTVPLFTLTVDGTVITDRAIYIHPSHDDWAASNRFPFDEICKYFVYMDDEKSNVYMSDIHSKSIIRGCTLFGRNTGGIELMQFVKALQAILLSHYTWAQEQQQTAVAELLTAARASMKTGRVSQELSVLLNTIEPSSPQYLAVKLVQAEDVYRSCDADAYHRFMENTTAEARAAIMQQQNSFEKALKADLSNIHLNFETNYLTEAYTNLSASPYRSDTDTLLFAYETYTVAATCTSPGYTVRECSVCGDRHIEVITPAIPHDYKAHVIEATCEAGGKTIHRCDGCGSSFVTDYTDALGHSWDKGTLVTNATCTGEGVMEYRCTRCGYLRLDADPADSHIPGNPATCTEPQLCTRCGAVLEKALGHDYKSEVKAPTCTEMGYTTNTCTRCGDTNKSD